MRRLVFLFSFATLVFSCLQLAAQEQPAPQTDATAYTSVSGHVICGDTGLPGRFAAVQLVPEKPQKTTFAADLGTVKDSKGFAKALAKNMAQPKKGTGLSAVSSIDGSFEMPKVPAGTYYVVAQLSGYPSPFSALTSMERFAADADAISRIQALAEKIVVQSAPVRLDVRLERGGSISGVIHYGDGSPAAGVSPVLMALQENGKWKADFDPGNQQKHTTDDRGRYRTNSSWFPGSTGTCRKIVYSLVIPGPAGVVQQKVPVIVGRYLCKFWNHLLDAIRGVLCDGQECLLHRAVGTNCGNTLFVIWRCSRYGLSDAIRVVCSVCRIVSSGR